MERLYLRHALWLVQAQSMQVEARLEQEKSSETIQTKLYLKRYWH